VANQPPQPDDPAQQTHGGWQYTGQQYTGQQYPGQQYPGQQYPGQQTPPPHYGAGPGYPPGPGYGYVGRPTNTLAILSLVMAFVFAPLGIVFGIMAKRQIAQTGEDGDALATAGLWIGVAFTALLALAIVAWIAMLALFVSTATTVADQVGTITSTPWPTGTPLPGP